MKRLTEAWFEFKGIRSTDMGIKFRKLATRNTPELNTTRKKVSGRHGTLKYGPETYGDVQVKIECDALEPEKMPQILGWLTGEGPLRFSDEPDFAYDASIEKGFSRAQISARFAEQRFTITWNCAPFRRAVPDPAQITIQASGTQITNPGTAPALPKIEIRGSGDFAVTIGMQTVFFKDVTGGIIVDSELGDALTLDGTLLANDHMEGELFEIQPGYNVISWLTGGEDDEGNVTEGVVTAVIITPRWRYF